MNWIERIYVKWSVSRGKAIDIRSGNSYPGSVLSNLCGNRFEMDGFQCGSMEGFLQALKHRDKQVQHQICQMKGRQAKYKSSNNWKAEQRVYWNGREIDRNSAEFQALIRRAYRSLFEQNERFRHALLLTRGKKLYHTLGSDNPADTILTGREFCTMLTELRENALARQESAARKKTILVAMDALADAVMKPLPEALEAVRELAALQEVHILSAPAWDDPSEWSERVRWMKRHAEEIVHDRLVLTRHPECVAGDCLITSGRNDDRNGFPGEVLQLGTTRFPDWKSVLEYLASK